MKNSTWIVASLALVGLAGCFGAHNGPGDDGSGDGCVAMDAEGVGACRAILGYVFDGAGCVSIGGCECVGADCDALFNSETSCEDACVASPPPPPPGSACDAQDVMGVGDCRAIAGWAWDGAACAVVGCACEGPDCDAIFDSAEVCEAAYRVCLPAPPPECAAEAERVPTAPVCRPGADRWYFSADGCVEGCPCVDGTGDYGWPLVCPPSYADEAACEAAHPGCGPTPPPPPMCVGEVDGPFERCEPRAEVFWFTERGCEPGCECSNPAGRCARSYRTIEECLWAHPACVGGACGPGRIGDTLCRRLPVWVWSGTACVPTSACEGDLYLTEAECVDDHRACVGPPPAPATRTCDEMESHCRHIRPDCPPGQVPEVVERCWGACVPIAECAPVACTPETAFRCPGDDDVCVDGACVF